MKNAVAEIVTFALADSVKSADFVEISKGTESFVRSLPGFVHRQLSEGEDGKWTDYVILGQHGGCQVRCGRIYEGGLHR